MPDHNYNLKNLITDIDGVLVGTAEDNELCTGVTVISANKPFSAAVDVRGGGPGTRETDMLGLENSVGRADAIVLSGGSAFGLDASSSIQRLLRQEKKGYVVGENIIPLVPSAVIFDLKSNNNYWSDTQSIWNKLGSKAYKNLSKNFDLGSIGAGMGATTGTVMGGQGSASWREKYSNDMIYTVGAIVINNAVGNPLNNDGPHFLSGHLEVGKEFGGLGASKENFDGVIRAKRINNHDVKSKSLSKDTFLKNDENLINTVVGVVATDAPLNRNQLKRLAIMSHDGIARSIHPSHTPMDGDTIFALSISEKSLNQSDKKNISKDDLLLLGTRCSDCVARSCNRGVYEASYEKKDKPNWKKIFNS